MTLYILTCLPRRSQLNATLASLKRSDWKDPVVIVNDDEAIEKCGLAESNPRERGTIAYAFILKMFLESGSPLALICEDDVVFNRHLSHNVARWSVLQREDFALGNLYNIGFAVVGENTKDAFEPKSSACYGTQALIVTSKLAWHALSAWDNYKATGQDIILFNECVKVGKHFVHRPSLVNHVSQHSLLNNHPHHACDFQPMWKGLVK